jgi:hypothetical protein
VRRDRRWAARWRRAGEPRLRDVEPAQHLVAGRPIARLLAQERVAQRGEVRRRAGAPHEHRLRLGAPLVEQDRAARADERKRAGEQLVEHDADRVPVAGGARLAGGLLGRRVRRRPDQRPVRAADLGDQPEIDEHHARLVRDEDVRRLDVAVEPVSGVQRGDPLRELRERRAEPVLVARRADVGSKVHGVEHLHREEPDSALAMKLVQPDQVRVRDPGERAHLALEPLQRRGRRIADRLERHAHLPPVVERLEDHAHRARPDAAPDLEPLRARECDRIGGGHPCIVASEERARVAAPVTANGPLAVTAPSTGEPPSNRGPAGSGFQRLGPRLAAAHALHEGWA